MEIAVTGEGKTDYGCFVYDKKKCANKWQWGPIAIYIKKIAEERNVDISLVPIERETIKKYSLGRNVKSGKGHEIPAKKFAYLMRDNDLEYGVFYCDTDKNTDSRNDKHNAEKENQAVHDEVQKGLIEAGVNAVPMVALRMIESWIMGDKNAIEKALDIKIKPNLYPSDPELLWGDEHDPSSDYPKNYLNRMIRKSDKKYVDFEGSREIFCEIAEETNIETLRKNCEISFDRFYQEFSELLSNYYYE